MRFIPMLSCALLFAVAGCGTAEHRAASTPQKIAVVENAPWREFLLEDEKISLVMPGAPTETTDADDVTEGVIQERSFQLRAVQDGYKAAYLVSYADYAPEQKGTLSAAEFLDSVWQTRKEDNEGLVIYKKKIKFGQYEGLEYQLKGKIQKNYVITGRDYLIGNRLLMLTAVMPKEQTARGDATKYLDSLRLTR